MSRQRKPLTEAQRVSQRAAGKRWRLKNIEREREKKRLYQLAHSAERDEAVRRFRAAHPERSREISRRWHARNPEIASALCSRWHADNPDKVRVLKQRRRARLAGVAVIRIDMGGACALCEQPIDRSLRYPDPMCFSVGHEPPLAWAAAHGDKTSVERPEHLICNLRKGTKPDHLLMGSSA